MDMSIFYDKFGITEESKIKKRKPTHGNCCTCQECGYSHADCYCYENLAVQVRDFVVQLQAENKSKSLKIKQLKSENANLRLSNSREWAELYAENKKLRAVVEHFEDCKEDVISDGVNSCGVDARCPECGFKAMQVVRPGKYQCGICG